jgi:hypothetical protein
MCGELKSEILEFALKIEKAKLEMHHFLFKFLEFVTKKYTF